MKSESGKYECGCGKIYSSYPAFSNHKKNKHENNNQPGTNIPKPYNPKRGRPSFTIPQKQANPNHSNYSALTCIQVGLLKLEDKFKGLLSETDEDSDLTILEGFQRCKQIAANKTALRLVSAIRNFTLTLITHIKSEFGEAVVEYFTSVTTFLLQNLSSQQISLNWDAELDEKCFKIDSKLFNRYYQQRGIVQKVKQLGKSVSMPLEVFLGLTILLSEYLCLMNISSDSLRIRQ